jgi:hypothetical protein
VAASEEGMKAVSTIVNRILNGRESQWEKLTAARLVPLVKSARKIRPIAIGEVLTRLAARIVLRQKSKELSQFLKPLQLGVREPGATEQIVHHVRQEQRRGKGVLTLDLTNAFNSIRREAIRKVLYEKLPDILPYFCWAYQGNGRLWYQEDLLALSREGVRQGDPLGPALFAVGIQGILEDLNEEFPQVNIYANLDDITATGDPEDLVALADRFSELAGCRGLVVNKSKSELFIPNGESPPQGSEHLRVTSEGLRILGSPVGTPEYEGRWCLQYVQNLKKMMLTRTEHSIPVQHRYILLKDSVIPALTHLWRTVPPWNREQAVHYFDSGLREIIKLLLGASLYRDGDQIENCTQISLPLRHGGLGLLEGHMISFAAYVASTWEAGIIHDQETRWMLVSRLYSQGVDISDDDLRQLAPNRKQQQNFTHQIMRNRLNSVLQTANENMQARVKAATQKGAHDYLTALPSSSSKSFSDHQWRIAVRLRLGLVISSRSVPRSCPLCKESVEDAGSHPFKCSYAELMNGRYDRHNKLRDTLIGALSSWGFPVHREPFVKRGSNLRGDIEVVQTDGPCILDVSVIHPTAIGTQQNLSPAAGTRIRERVKENKYGQVCREMEKKLVPFVFQTYGGIGEQALTFLSELKNRPASLHVYQPVQFVDSVRVGLSCRFMQSNVNLISRWLQLVLPLRSGGAASHMH